MAEKSITASYNGGDKFKVESYKVIDNETGKAVPFIVKPAVKEGEYDTLKLSTNSANRTWLAIGRIIEAEGKKITLGFKPTMTIGVASVDKANLIPAKFVAYLTAEEKQWYDALLKKVVDAYNAANPHDKKSTGTSQKAEMEAALAKKFGISVDELRKIVEDEKAAKEAKKGAK
jgi:hypothetical protein